MSGLCDDNRACLNDQSPAWRTPLIGGLIAGLVGLANSKPHQIEIVPIVSPSKSFGTTTGSSLQVNF